MKGQSKMAEKDSFAVDYRDDGVIVYHFWDVHRETVDTWFEVTTKHDQEAFAANEHLRRIFYFHGTLMPTPYAFSLAHKAADLTPDGLVESVAIVVENLLVFQLIATFVNRLPIRQARSVTRIFRDVDSALEWLKQRGQALK
jgi:hypothetical protein